MDPKESLLRRELAESRARENEYRRRLWRHRELSQKLRVHNDLLHDALKQPASGPDWLDGLLHQVATLTGQALEVPRTSIWLFDETREHLVCRRLVSNRVTDDEPFRIPSVECPGYIDALTRASSSAVAVGDTLADPRTAELKSYLQQTGVRALLDIPIVGPGVLRGVVCHEELSGPREWLEEEIDFATDVGALVSIAIESDRRLQAELLAQGSDAKYKHLVESLPVTVYSFELRTGELDYVSPRIRQLSSVSAEQYLVEGGLQRWIEAIDPEHRAGVRLRLAGGSGITSPTELTYPIRLADGTTRWIRDTCALVRDAHGRAFAAQGTLADITALKEAQLAREELEHRYQTLFERADFLALILDRDGRVQFINDAFCKAVGIPKQEARGVDGFSLGLVDPERSFMREQYLVGMQTGRLVPRGEATLVGRSGTARRVLWTNTLVHGGGGQIAGAAIVGVDITERLELQTAQLEREKLESLGRLAASVAHDFNNLLTVIGTSMDLIAETCGAHELRILQDTRSAVEQATQLTSSLLTYARREKASPTRLNPDELIQRLLPMLVSLVGATATLSHELGASRAQLVMDPTQFRQLLLNLVGNAGEAVRGTGSNIRLTTRLAALDEAEARAHGLTNAGGFFVLSVADDGSGIANNVLPRIFDPFFTTKAEGTGLGLATCDAVVRRAGGFITVKSALLQGTTFDVYLPATEQVPAVVHAG